MALIPNHANDPETPRLRLGERVEWTYVLTNIGTEAIPIDEVSLVDSDPNVNAYL